MASTPILAWAHSRTTGSGGVDGPRIVPLSQPDTIAVRRSQHLPISRRRTKAEAVPRVVVDVMPKPEILDPQGQAVLLALRRLGQADAVGVTEVRQGKRFLLHVDGDLTDEALARIRGIAVDVLSNPVIEDVVSVRAIEGNEPEGDRT
jgi:phosphoribosylformylglycinamidine synthase subunit PurS